MKKLLLATVALLTLATAAHAEINLDLGGYFKGYAGYTAGDSTGDARNLDFKRKSQVYFTGETTLDNGLTVGYNGQLIQDTSVDPNVGQDAKVEQSYLYFSGNWGRINLGRENGAAYLLQVAAPGADSNLDGMDVAFSFFNQGNANIRQDYGQTGAGTVAGQRGENFQYADKITYLTPKFNGFQIGFTYTPDVTAKDTNSYFGNDSNATPGGYENLFEAGARYDGNWSNFGVHLGAGFTNAENEADAVIGAGTVVSAGIITPVAIIADSKTYKEFNLGGKLTYGGFGVGLVYDNRDGGTPYAGLGDVDTWAFGLDYTRNAFNVGASYLNSSGDGLLGGSDDYDRYTIGAGYTFGPGMKFNGSVAYHDLSSTTAGDNNAGVVAVGTDIQF